MVIPARVIDAGIGLSALSWAVLGLTLEGTHPLPVRAAIAALNASVGALFLLRRPAEEHGGLREIASALPSMIVAGLAYRLSPASWPLPHVTAFALGAIGAIVTLGALGRSFAILPARRALVERGPYAWVRHPAYACELVMIGAAALAGAWAWALIPAALLTLWLRVRAEERFLERDPAFRAYAQRVRARLVPFLL